MKVLFISPIAPPYGGLPTWTEEYRKAFRNVLDVVCVNTNYTGRNPVAPGKRSIPQELVRSVRIWKSIWKNCKNTQYDIVHLNSPCSVLGNIRDWVSMLLIRICHASKVNVLHCHCDLTDFVGDNKIRLAVFRLFLKWFDCVLVLNEQSLDYIRKMSSVKAVSIPNFISDPGFGEKPLRSAESGLRVLFLGRQTTLKGIDIFIQVAQMAQKNGDGFSFSVVGNPGVDWEQFSPLPENLKISRQLERDEALKMLYDTDVLLFPSRTEGFPFAVLEAMMFGTPVISSNVGAVSQMLEHTGAVVLDSFDPRDYYEALKKYLPIREREKISVREKERYRRYFSPAAVQDLILNEYERLQNRE